MDNYFYKKVARFLVRSFCVSDWSILAKSFEIEVGIFFMQTNNRQEHFGQQMIK